MGFSRFRHIKYQLISYNVILLFIVVLVAIVANQGTIYSLKTYNEYSERYEELNGFFQSVSETDAAAKSYLYSKLDSTLDYYEEQKESAKRILDTLKANTKNEEMRWNYEKLGDMFQTYDEMFHMVNERKPLGNLSMTETYEFFIRIPDNIADSYQKCSTMIADEMKKSDLLMHDAWEKQIFLITILVGGMIVGAAAFSIAGTRSITQPIGKIVKDIEGIKEGEYKLAPVKSKCVELQVLDHAVWEMAHVVQTNIRHMEERAHLEMKLLEKENENLKVNELLIETELQVLQQQINPHFLFNTLSMISKMAYLEKAMKTSHLMEITADVMRYSLDKANGASDLAGEIECVKNYLEIQKVRFGGRISFQLAVQEGLPNIVMPGMVVQPLIENAVIHGVKDVMEHARIAVIFGELEGSVFIRVEDNGAGMDGDMIQELLQGEDKLVKENKRKSIGIFNVRKRLEMFYGKKGMMQIESSPGCGTVVSIKLPQAEGGELCIDC